MAIEYCDYRIHTEDAKRIIEAILQKKGINAENAVTVAENLVFADERGIYSHGISRLESYCNLIDKGFVKTDAQPRVVNETASTLFVDADRSFGSVAGTFAMKRTLEKAKETGIAFCNVFNATHFGAAGYYSLMAVEQGMIGFSLTNAGHSLAPYGTYQPLLGTNPISIAVPTAQQPPLLLDMATSVVAQGNVLNARREGKPVPENWCYDGEGNMTTDPNKMKAMMPIGGYKGSGLALMVDILSGVLAGRSYGQHLPCWGEPSPHGSDNSFCFAAIDISAFRDVDAFKTNVDAEIQEIKSAPLANDRESILMPGEPELIKQAVNREKGYALAEGTLKCLCELCETLGVALNPCDYAVKQ